MKFINLFWRVIIVISILPGCSVSNKVFIHTTPIGVQINNSLQNDKIHKSKFVYYLVENYKNLEGNDKMIDEFYCNSLDSVGFYNDYYITFLKKSKFTNFTYLEKYPKELDRYSVPNDILFNYHLSNGRLLVKQKFHGGKDSYTATKSVICDSP